MHLPADQEVDAVRPRREPGDIRAMTFRIILFEYPQDSLKRETPEAPDFFSDLNFGQIIDAVTAGLQEYNLKPLWRKHLKNSTFTEISFRRFPNSVFSLRPSDLCSLTSVL